MQILEVPLKKIDADEKFNSRKTYEDIDALASDIKERGLINPLIVTPKGKNFSLVAGFRRHRALAQLGVETVPVQIYESSDPADLLVMNMAENLSRHQISTYETAHGCFRLARDFNLTSAEVSRRLSSGEGMSASYVGNLIRCAERLCPEIQEDWRKSRVFASVRRLTYASKFTDQSDQLKFWRTIKGADTPDIDGEEGDLDPSKIRAPRRPAAAKLKEAIDALKRCKLPASKKSIALQALEWAALADGPLVIGEVVIFDPKPGRPRKANAARK